MPNTSLNLNRHVYLTAQQLSVFRTQICSQHRRGNCVNPDRCPDSHCQTWQRRNPYKYIYAAKMCPDIEFVKKGNKMTLVGHCTRGRVCAYAHSKEEELYHPTMYKTKMCNAHPHCTRYFCPFAHHLFELRDPNFLLAQNDSWKNNDLLQKVLIGCEGADGSSNDILDTELEPYKKKSKDKRGRFLESPTSSSTTASSCFMFSNKLDTEKDSRKFDALSRYSEFVVKEFENQSRDIRSASWDVLHSIYKSQRFNEIKDIYVHYGDALHSFVEPFLSSEERGNDSDATEPLTLYSLRKESFKHNSNSEPSDIAHELCQQNSAGDGIHESQKNASVDRSSKLTTSHGSPLEDVSKNSQPRDLSTPLELTQKEATQLPAGAQHYPVSIHDSFSLNDYVVNSCSTFESSIYASKDLTSGMTETELPYLSDTIHHRSFFDAIRLDHHGKACCLDDGTKNNQEIGHEQDNEQNKKNRTKETLPPTASKTEWVTKSDTPVPLNDSCHETILCNHVESLKSSQTISPSMVFEETIHLGFPYQFTDTQTEEIVSLDEEVYKNHNTTMLFSRMDPHTAQADAIERVENKLRHLNGPNQMDRNSSPLPSHPNSQLSSLHIVAALLIQSLTNFTVYTDKETSSGGSRRLHEPQSSKNKAYGLQTFIHTSSEKGYFVSDSSASENRSQSSLYNAPLPNIHGSSSKQSDILYDALCSFPDNLSTKLNINPHDPLPPLQYNRTEQNTASALDFLTRCYSDFSRFSPHCLLDDNTSGSSHHIIL